MATGNGGSKMRLIVLLVALVAVAGFGWYMLMGGGLAAMSGGGGIDSKVIGGELVGKTLDDVSAALGVQGVEQANPDGEKSTAKIYLYTLAAGKPDRQFVKVRVAADGRVQYTRFVDATGNEVNVDSQR